MNENDMNLYIAHYNDPAAEEGYQLLIDEPTTFSRLAWLSITIGLEKNTRGPRPRDAFRASRELVC